MMLIKSRKSRGINRAIKFMYKNIREILEREKSKDIRQNVIKSSEDFGWIEDLKIRRYKIL